MGTPLSKLYDRLISKLDQDLSGMDELIYNYVDTAIAKAYKTVPHDLDYNLDNNNATFEIYSVSSTPVGNITIDLNGVDYNVEVLSSDSKLAIANKIKTVIDGLSSPSYITSIDNLGINPILTIVQDSGDISSVGFTDTDSTGVNIIISKTYEGSFIETLDSDEIELLALLMLYEIKRRRKERLEAIRKSVGTRDFNSMPDYIKEFKEIGISLEQLNQEIKDLRNEFYTYSYE